MSCHVMLYNICFIRCVMLCYITYVMLRYITYVMLWHLNCISFQCNCENSVLFALGVKYKTALIYQADHKLLSWRNPLYLNHVIFFVAVETCCIYLGSRPYKEDYQVSRISHKVRVSRAFTQPSCKVFQCFNIEDFQSRIIEWTSFENSQATKRSLEFCMT